MTCSTTSESLLPGFEWCDLDITGDATANSLYEFLRDNYGEDDNKLFRFDYSLPFLRWALMAPKYRKEWHLGVKVTKTQKLVGFISAIPVNIRIHSDTVSMYEINFLCVHKKLRKHHLALTLIREIIRRGKLIGPTPAIYTSQQSYLSQPITQANYYHRTLNSTKVLDTQFTQLGPRMTRSQFVHLNRLPKSLTTNIRLMTFHDIVQCYQLFTSYMKKYDLAPEFTQEEFTYWILPRKDIVYTYVITDSNNIVTDMVSFYNIPSTSLLKTNMILRAAYAYYIVITKSNIKSVMSDALILARDAGFDVFTCLDIMDNATWLSDLRFTRGTGDLQYYLFEYNCSEMLPANLGLVML